MSDIWAHPPTEGASFFVVGVPNPRRGPSLVHGRYFTVQVEHLADFSATTAKGHCDAIRWWLDRELDP